MMKITRIRTGGCRATASLITAFLFLISSFDTACAAGDAVFNKNLADAIAKVEAVSTGSGVHR
jgi:hypothetical protein